MGPAVVAEVVDHQRRVDELRLHASALVVEHPQRVDLGAATGLLVEVEAGEELLEQRAVGRPARGVAEGVESAAGTGSGPAPRKPASADGDHLGVERRVVDAERLDADLAEVAVAAGLRPLVAEEGARRTRA